MNYFEYFLMAYRAIRTKKMRSFLTMLGLIIGVASIVVIVAIGEGNKRQIQEEIKKSSNRGLERPKRVNEHLARLRFHQGKPVVWYGDIRERRDKAAH